MRQTEKGSATAKLATAAAVIVGLMVVVLLPHAEAAVFSNPTAINMPGPGPGNPPPTPAQPYPSNITVSGLTGTITDVNLTLNDFDCSARGQDRAYPEDVDIMLVSPTGLNAVVLSDIGGANLAEMPSSEGQFPAIDVTLDDQAANPLPADTQLSAGTYRPTDDDDDTGEQAPVDVWNPPAPAPSGATALSTFNGTEPNGTWSLYVVDDWPGPQNCVIAGGWSLDILTSAGPTTTGLPTTTTTMGVTTTTVAGPNQPPIAVDDAYVTAHNSTLTILAPGVLFNDSDPNGDPLTAGMPTMPANGTLSLNTNGGFTYTPNTGFSGVDTWTYMAHDPNGGMTTATVRITVNAPPPTTTSTSTSTSTSSTTTSTTTGPTTSSSTSTTTGPTTTSSSTSTTAGPTTTTRPGATTTTAAGACKPGNGSGKADKKHCHSGPPGQTGEMPGNGGGGGQGINGSPASSNRPVSTPWLLGGLGVLLLVSLGMPFRRNKGDHRTKR